MTDTLDILRAKYNEYNKLYFDNQLPTIPMRWGRLKTATAHVAFKTIGKKSAGYRYLEDTMVMVFSTKWQRTAEELFPILLHEMVHVYLIGVAGDIKDNHGPAFHDVLRKLKYKSGVDIPVTDKAKEDDKLTDSSIVPYGVILQYIGNGKIAYALFSEKVMMAKMDEIKARYADAKRYNVEARVVRSDRWTRKGATQPLSRIVSYKTKFFYISEEDMADLKDNSEVVWSNQSPVTECYHGSDQIYELLESTSDILVRKPSSGSVIDFYHEKDEAFGRLVNDYNHSKPRPWRVVPANLIKMVWTNAAKLGFVRSEKAIDTIANIFYNNIMQIMINNEISGHDTTDPEEMMDEYFNEDEMEAFVDWAIECETGWRISDYGIDALVKYACLLKDAVTAEEKLQICDAILNVTHPRSDLASWFVEGGARTMDGLAED